MGTIAERNEQLKQDTNTNTNTNAVTATDTPRQFESVLRVIEPVVKVPKGTPLDAPLEVIDPTYKGWSQKYRETTSILEEFRLKEDDERTRKLHEDGRIPQDALSVFLDVLSIPQEMILAADAGRPGHRMTVQQYIDKMTPGGVDVAIKALKDRGYGETFIAALFTLPAVALTVVTDPLNVIAPGEGAASKAGVKAAAAAASTASEGKKTAFQWITNRVVGGSSLTADERAVSNIAQVKTDQLKVRPEDHPDPINPEKVKAIGEKLAKDPSKVPALEVALDKNGELIVKDGRHRLQAAKEAGAESVPATIAVPKEAAKDPIILKKASELSGDPVFQRLLGEEGLAAMPMMLAVTRATIGGTAGALVGDEEDRLRNMLIGAGLGAFATPAVARRLVSVFREDKALRQPFLATAAGREAARLAKLEKAWSPSEFSERYFKELEGYTQGTRSVETVKEEAALMEKYGHVTEEGILRLQPGAILNDAEKTALVNVATKSGQRLKQLAEAVNPEIPESYDEFLRQLYRHGQLDIRRIATTAEEGRVLRMEQELEGEKAFLAQFTNIMSRMKFGQSKERMVELVKATQDLDHLTMFAKQISRPKFMDMATEVWVNGLLSGFKTMTTNTLGNGAFLLWNIGERGLSRLYSNNIVSGEARAMVMGALASFEDALKVAWHSFRQEGGEIPGELAKRVGKTGASKLERPIAITTENVNDLALMRKLGMRIDETGVVGRSIDGLGSWFFRLPGRVLVSTDEFFKAIAFRAELRAQAYREAFAEVEAQKLTGKAAHDAFEKAVKRIEANPSDDIADKAKAFAAYTTFTKELGPAGKALQELSQASPMARIVLPFVRAPINLFKAGLIERTPLAFLSQEVRQTIARGGADADLAMTKIAMGSMMSAMFASWAASGYITGGGPSDPTERDNWRAGGWQPHSINVSKLVRAVQGQFDGDTNPRPGDQYIQLDRLEPLGMILGMAADVSEVWGQLSEEDRDIGSAAIVLGTAFSKNFASKTFVKGVAELTVALADPDRFAQRTAIHEAGTLVPMSSAVAGVTREIDPTIRDAQTVVDAMRARVWPFSTSVYPDRDLFGNPKTYSPGLGPDIASPFYTSTYKAHPVLDALKEDKARIANIGRNLNGVDLKTHPELYDRLQVLAGHEVRDAQGRNYEEAMLDVVKEAEENDYPIGPDSWRAERFREVTREFHRLAREQLLAENPDLAEAVGEVQAEMKSKKTPGGVDIQVR